MEGKSIIIKKRKRAVHEGGHGSAWKVAYADFVTAMMAFFLLLWLVTMVEPEKRARLSNYFKNFSVFEKSGTSLMDVTPKLDLTDILNERAQQAMRKAQGMRRAQGQGVSAEDLKEKLKQEIESKLSDVKDQVMVEIFEGGVRIQIVDKDGSTMFPLGSSELTPNARKILKVITDNIREGDNPVAIEGHTDALAYATTRYTNWELSTERASAARKELENNGLDTNRLIRVSGFAATDPLIRENPYDPRNRRISILLTYPNAAQPAAPLGPPAPQPAASSPSPASAEVVSRLEATRPW